MQGVARLAGVSKPTIYKRFGGKHALAVAALKAVAPSNVQPSRRRSVNLGRLVIDFNRDLREVRIVNLLAALLTAGEHDPSLLAAFHEGVLSPRLRNLAHRLQNLGYGQAADGIVAAAVGEAVIAAATGSASRRVSTIPRLLAHRPTDRPI